MGNNLTVDNGGTVGTGKVTYGGTFTGSITAYGGSHHEDPTFSFADEFTTLQARSAQWADLSGTPVTGAGYGVTFTGQNKPLNVFSVKASVMEGINGIVLAGMPSTSTVLINVTMDKANGSFTGVLNAIDLGGVPPENIPGTSWRPRVWRSAATGPARSSRRRQRRRSPTEPTAAP